MGDVLVEEVYGYCDKCRKMALRRCVKLPDSRVKEWIYCDACDKETVYIYRDYKNKVRTAVL